MRSFRVLKEASLLCCEHPMWISRVIRRLGLWSPPKALQPNSLPRFKKFRIYRMLDRRISSRR
jgi:hypothetical protein